MKYYVDRTKQAQEKNTWWGDYPTIGLTGDGKLRHGKSLRNYYGSWEAYITQGGVDGEADIARVLHDRKH